MPATTHIINWLSNDGVASANKPPLTIITKPESIAIGDNIEISLFSAYSHNLISPYHGLGSKTTATVNNAIEELVDLSGSSELSTKFPIASVTSMVAEIAIVDETSRAVLIESGLSVLWLVSVINQKLVINNPTLKLYGSLKLVYNTFNAQQWIHTAFQKKGSALLFAHNLTILDYENVPLTIGDVVNTNTDNIKILPYPMATHAGIQPYCNVIVLPASKNPVVKTDKGTVINRGSVMHTIPSEPFTLSNAKKFTPAFAVDSFDSQTGITGYFFNAAGNVVTPSFHLENGVIVASVDCSGSGFVSYQTEGIIYEYSALVESTPPTLSAFAGVSITVRKIFAFDPLVAGIAAVYEVPELSLAGLNRNSEGVLEVYYETLVNQYGTYELPPNISSGDNTYPSAVFIDSELPKPWGYSVEKIPVETVRSLGVSLTSEIGSTMSQLPFTGNENKDRVYKISKNLPENIEQHDAINAKELELKSKWRIS